MTTAGAAGFREQDAVWIDDGYAGAPHSATVTGVGSDSLWAESFAHIPGDSRVLAWEIRADRVAAMVTARGAGES